ncbi:RidA family protein [Acetobacter senegalensis]|uniref:hypothetical protein n=1 Tax=Acetobacter senegalensis TaxID=446692 RepID=UPI0026551C53|nr:hypothetical protein [Acetobacter senegalensis]MDN7349888.1 hypothetical protein [Acetobacter senegalensis]
MTDALHHTPFGSPSAAMPRVEHTPAGMRIRGLRSSSPQTQTIAEQCAAALETGTAILARDDLSLKDVTRVVYVIEGAADFPSCFPLLRQVFSNFSPSLTFMWVKSMTPAGVKIELELCVEAEPV